MARFASTHCSQCGKDLGPGDAGVSHCEHHDSPQSCYPETVATLREMIAGEQERIEMLTDKPVTASRAYSIGVSTRRIEALTTAIEALGGAL